LLGNNHFERFNPKIHIYSRLPQSRCIAIKKTQNKMTDTNTTNTKPFACDEGCKKAFATKRILVQHKKRGCPGVEKKEKISLLCVECGATFTERKAKARHVAKCAPKGTKETPLLVADAVSSVNDASTVDLSSRQNQDNVSLQIARVLHVIKNSEQND
jgi:hypothetical protein